MHNIVRRWWPYAVVTTAVVLLRLHTLSNKILSIDEASYLVQALRLRSLESFIFAFQFRIETKSQVGLIPYLLANAIDRGNAIFLVHVFGSVAVIAGCCLMVLLAGRFMGSAPAGVAAGLIWAIYLVVGPGLPDFSSRNIDGYGFFQAPRLEYFQVPFLLLSLYWWLEAIETQRDCMGSCGRRVMLLFAGAGTSWAVAFLVKPSAALFAISMLVSLPLFQVAGGGGRVMGGLIPGATTFVLGALFPVALVLAPYLVRPAALEEIWVNVVHVSLWYTDAEMELSKRSAGLIAGIPTILIAAFLLVPAALFVQLRSLRSTRQVRAIVQTWLACVALFLGVLQGQAHLYYLTVVVPFGALAVTGQIALTLRSPAASGRLRLAQAIVLISTLIYLFPQLPALTSYANHPDRYLQRDRRRFDLDGLVSYIRTSTPPDGKMWVYYNTPELFVLSERLPVTRDPAGIWLVVLWEEPWFQRTVDDLSAECPDLIIGINRPRYHYPHTPHLLEIPRIGEWIAQAYECDVSRIHGATVCRLARRPDSCRSHRPAHKQTEQMKRPWHGNREGKGHSNSPATDEMPDKGDRGTDVYNPR